MFIRFAFAKKIQKKKTENALYAYDCEIEAKIEENPHFKGMHPDLLLNVLLLFGL